MWLLAAALLSSFQEWDERIDPACCPYPEHDPRDYNWPYSHLQYSEVIPDVLGSFVPMTELNLSYPSGEIVEYGKPLAPSAITQPPQVRFTVEPGAETLHTLIAVDPDVPFRDRPEASERLLWLVHDIPGNRTGAGKTLVEYAPPQPAACPESERLCLPEHRVTFALFEQPNGALSLHAEDVAIGATETAGRERYQARDFAARHQLGLQVAMNFFETWYDAGDGRFAKRPWWHVTDEESLARVNHLIPHVERPSERPRAKDEL